MAVFWRKYRKKCRFCAIIVKKSKNFTIKIVDFQGIKTDGENKQVFGENEQVKKKYPF